MQQYIISTLLTLSISILIAFTFKDHWALVQPEEKTKKSFSRKIKGYTFVLCFCLIPFIRWVWVLSLLALSMTLLNVEAREAIVKNIEKGKEIDE